MSLLDLFDVGYAVAPDGGRVAYGVAGSGERNVLALSAGFFSFEATTESPLMTEWWQMLLALGRVIALDSRGIGRSDPMPPHYDDEVRLADILAVLDAVGVETVDVVGTTMGATLGLLFAARQPRRVRSVVAIQPYARFRPAADYPHAAGDAGEAMLMRNIREGWGSGGFLLGPVNAADPTEDQSLRRLAARAERLSASPAAVEQLFRVHADLDLRAELPNVDAPVLVLDYPQAPMTVRRPGAARDVADRLAHVRYVEIDGQPSLISGQPLAFAHIVDFLGADTHRVTKRAVQTVLLTDIVDSTKRAAALGDDRWGQLLDEHDRIVRDQVGLAGGCVVKATGDGALATLPTPSGAVACAEAIAAALARVGLDVRCGIHLGEVEMRGEDIGGIGVHIAARIAAIAGRGEVVISDTALTAATGSGIAAVDAGEHVLKGVPGTWRLWRLCVTGDIAVPTPRTASAGRQVV